MPKNTLPRSFWLLCGAALIGAVSIATAMPAARLAADDAQVCRQEAGDAALSACSRAIASGRYQGRGLAELLDYRGFEYRQKRNYDRAMADYDEAVRVAPQYAHAFSARANAWQTRGDNDRAIADYGAAIRLNPDNASYYNDRGTAWLAKREYDRAIEDFTTVIQNQPRALS